MDTFDRRSFLATTGSLAAAAVAGCSGGGDQESEDNYVGDSATIGGIAFTLHHVALSDALTLQGPADGSDDGASEQTVEPGDGQILAAVLEIENTTDSAAGVPIPDGTAISQGEINLAAAGEGAETGSSIPPIDPYSDEHDWSDWRYPLDGSAYDRLTLVVGEYQAELPAGTAVAGWMAYLVGAEFAPEDHRIVVDLDPQVVGKNATWRLREPEG